MGENATTAITSAFDWTSIQSTLISILPWIIGAVGIVFVFKVAPTVFRGVVRALRSVAGKLIRH